MKRRDEHEDYCTFIFDIMQKKHEYESLKCEPSGYKLWYLLQSLGSTLDNLVTKESMFYTIAHMNHNLII